MSEHDKDKETATNETQSKANKRAKIVINEKHESEKPREKIIVGRAHFNNLDLSHHAKHDWRAEYEAHIKLVAAARAKKAAERGLRTPPETMTVRVYFQTLDRTGDEEGELLPANDPAFDDDPLVPVPIEIENSLNYVDIVVPSALIDNYSAKDLVDALGTERSDIFSGITYKQKNTIPPPYYLENIKINPDSYTTTPDEEGYNPDTPLPEEITIWNGNAWMFLDLPEGWNTNGDNTYLPDWDPDDNEDWDPNDPDGDDDYPNGTLDMYEPLWQLLAYNNTLGKYEMMFSFETQCFDFIYMPRIFDGVTKWVMVIRPMRRKKKQ
jgi:hypothetical protein